MSVDRRADEHRRERRENIGLHGTGEQIERHQRDRHEQTRNGQNNADDENAAHDVAEEAHDQREAARQLLHEIERDHDDARLGEGF